MYDFLLVIYSCYNQFRAYIIAARVQANKSDSNPLNKPNGLAYRFTLPDLIDLQIWLRDSDNIHAEKEAFRSAVL